MSDKIIDPHTNKPVAKEPAGIPVVAIGDYRFPVRILDRLAFKEGKVNPFEAFAGLTNEVTDRNTLVLMGMLALAEDIYSRDVPTEENGVAPKRSFQEFCKQLGLKVMDVGGKTIDFAAELSKI